MGRVFQAERKSPPVGGEVGEHKELRYSKSNSPMTIKRVLSRIMNERQDLIHG